MIYPTITDHDGATLAGWDGSSLNTDGFSAVIIEVTAIVGTVTIKGGVSSTNTISCRSLADATGALLSAITAPGLYAVPAAGTLTAVISSSATMNVRWKREVLAEPGAVTVYDSNGVAVTYTTTPTVQGTVAAGAADSGNPVKVGGVYNAALPTYTTGQRGDVQMSAKGIPYAALADPGNGTAVSVTGQSTDAQGGGNVGLAVTGFNYVFNGTSWDRVRKPNASSRITSAAASTNATSGKASSGNLHNIDGYNAAATVRYLKIYNKASAPTVGTDTPILTLPLAPSSRFQFYFEGGFYFSTGIAYALTTGAVDGDTGALTAADVVGLTISYS